MSAVHASHGPLEPASRAPDVRGRHRLLARPGHARRRHAVPWAAFRADYTEIRRRIARVVPGCAAYDEKVEPARRLRAAAPAARHRDVPDRERAGRSSRSARSTCSTCPEGGCCCRRCARTTSSTPRSTASTTATAASRAGAGSSSCTPTTSPRPRLRRRRRGRPGQRVARRRRARPRRLPGRVLRPAARAAPRRTTRRPTRWSRSTPRPRAATRPTSKSVVVRLEPTRWRAGRRRSSDAGLVTSWDDAHHRAEHHEQPRAQNPCEFGGSTMTAHIEVLTPREVPLGGPRAMTVRRTLPQRERSLIGAWCFLDHYGPDDVADTGGMCVAAAPAHRAADGELAVHRRDRAPRQRRPPRDGAPRRGQPDDRRPRHQPLRGLHARRPRRCTAPSSGSRCPDAARDVDPGFEHYAPGAGDRRRLGGAGLPRLAARRHLAGRHRTRRCSAPSCCSTPGAALRPRRRRGVRARRAASTPASSRSTASRAKPHELAYVAARLVDAHARRPTTSARAAAARRPAVRRADRDVVELRRPHPRGGRRLPRRVAGPDSRRPASRPTAGSASRSATTCRRSPPPRCPTPGCKERH